MGSIYKALRDRRGGDRGGLTSRNDLRGVGLVSRTPCGVRLTPGSSLPQMRSTRNRARGRLNRRSGGGLLRWDLVFNTLHSLAINAPVQHDFQHVKSQRIVLYGRSAEHTHNAARAPIAALASEGFEYRASSIPLCAATMTSCTKSRSNPAAEISPLQRGRWLLAGCLMVAVSRRNCKLGSIKLGERRWSECRSRRENA